MYTSTGVPIGARATAEAAELLGDQYDPNAHTTEELELQPEPSKHAQSQPAEAQQDSA